MPEQKVVVIPDGKICDYIDGKFRNDTPEEYVRQTIEKRLVAAVQGDFAIALYNPASHRRHDYLKKACQIMISAGADKERACGYTQNIGRDDEKMEICTLLELMEKEIDMFTTVFIGNSKTQIISMTNGAKKLVTKRGYEI